jgi:hypothetical protein
MPSTIDPGTLEDLALALAPRDLAAISSAAVSDVVGGWDTVSGVSFAVEGETFRSRDRMAAMTFGMIARSTSRHMPAMRSVTVVARIVEGQPRIVHVGLEPPSHFV